MTVAQLIQKLEGMPNPDAMVFVDYVAPRYDFKDLGEIIEVAMDGAENVEVRLHAESL